ncbi:MAG TPA: addiction module protein [Tepidisphaeraceae bacterium]|jgi:putative addiction module component (TIGR02574 family)|nr:addiction module protein [Tepidisphaeraceae bacterium]
MSRTQQQLLEEVLALPADVRAELAEKLLASLDGPDVSAVDRAWAQEAERRMIAIESGEMEVVDGAEILKMLRQRQK